MRGGVEKKTFSRKEEDGTPGSLPPRDRLSVKIKKDLEKDKVRKVKVKRYIIRGKVKERGKKVKNVIKCKSYRSRFINNRIVRSRNRNRNGIFGINKFNIKESVSESGSIYVCNIGVCVN